MQIRVTPTTHQNHAEIANGEVYFSQSCYFSQKILIVPFQYVPNNLYMCRSNLPWGQIYINENNFAVTKAENVRSINPRVAQCKTKSASWNNDKKEREKEKKLLLHKFLIDLIKGYVIEFLVVHK